MLNEWLEHSQRPKSSLNFNVVDINEKDGRNLERVNEIFKYIFLDNTISYDLIEKMSAKIGWNATFTNFISPRLTKQKNMQKGKFGEMLEGAILEEFFNFVIPIKKWRYSITSDQSLPSTDIIAIKNNESEITEMSFIESKVTGTDNKKLVTIAYEQLMNDQNTEFPQILSFIIARLLENNNPLSEKFIDYCLKKNRNSDSYRVCTVYDKQKWDDKSLENLNEVVLKSTSNLTVDVIRIESLDNVITEIYKDKGWNVIE
jgi:hypothetical protein